MDVHFISKPADALSRQLLETSESLFKRHRLEALSDTAAQLLDSLPQSEATQILISSDGEIIGGSRLSALATTNLLQTVYNRHVQGNFPAPSSLGADWTGFFLCLDRCEDPRPVLESAALLFQLMAHALFEGYAFITFVSTGPQYQATRAVGWSPKPLGAADPIAANAIAYCIDVSTAALESARAACPGLRQSFPKKHFRPLAKLSA